MDSFEQAYDKYMQAKNSGREICSELTEELIKWRDEMKILMDRIHMQQQAQKLNAMIMQSNDIKIIKKEIPSETEQNNDNRTDMNSDVNDKQSQQ